jgi:hypothetical protein
MQLGTQTNSLVNHLHARAVIGQPEPVVGMGVTLLGWTDRYAGTIVEVEPIAKGSVLVHVMRDESKVIAGSAHDGSAEYEFTPATSGARYTFRRNDDGTWSEVYRKVLEWDDEGNPSKVSPRWSKMTGGGKGLRIGEREEYRDPSF